MPVNLLPKNKKGIEKYWRKNPRSINKYRFVDHFLPHPEKKKRANLVSNKAMLLYCLVFVTAIGVLRMVPRVAPGILGYASNINITDLLKYTNQKRAESGLPSLVINDALTKAAEQKARHMFENNYWAHVSPSGREPWYFILSEDYDYVYAGENLAKNFSTSKEVVEAWDDSPSHRDNLLSPNYDEIGFAVVNGILDGYETTLVVQMFGKPRTPSRVASVYTESPPEEGVSVQEVPAEVPVVEEIPQEVSQAPTHKYIFVTPEREVLPLFDVATASRSLSLAFAGFMVFMFALDIWYSRRKGVVKFTGHTLAHLSILILVLVSIIFVIRPGAVI